ncbi:MAG TPA: sugar phosphate isomerase/epimerase [Chthoniobacterales bacterium]
MKPSLQLGVQSHCFRHFKDNALVAQKVRGLGLDRIELSGAHADFSQPEAFGPVVETYRQAGISIVSLGVQTFVGADSEKAWFECAAAAGARHISAHFQVDSYLKAIPRVRAWCREFGMKAGIHCHGGYTFGGQPDVIRHLLGLGGPEIGVFIDTAWVLQIGPWRGNPVEWAREFAGQITGVHYKDFVFDRRGQWKDVIVGQGNLDLPAFVRALDEGGFEGIAIVEYEGDVENPEPALQACVEAMRKLAG